MCCSLYGLIRIHFDILLPLAPQNVIQCLWNKLARCCTTVHSNPGRGGREFQKSPLVSTFSPLENTEGMLAGERLNQGEQVRHSPANILHILTGPTMENKVSETSSPIFVVQVVRDTLGGREITNASKISVKYEIVLTWMDGGRHPTNRSQPFKFINQCDLFCIKLRLIIISYKFMKFYILYSGFNSWDEKKSISESNQGRLLRTLFLGRPTDTNFAKCYL